MPLTIIYSLAALFLAGLVGSLVDRRRGNLAGACTALGILLFSAVAYVFLVQLLFDVAFGNM